MSISAWWLIPYFISGMFAGAYLGIVNYVLYRKSKTGGKK